MSIESIATKISDFQTKYPKKVLWIFIFLNLLFIPGIFNLVSNVEPSLEKVLPLDIEEIQTMNLMRSQFGADMFYLIIKTNSIDDVRSQDYIFYVNKLSQKIETNSIVIGTQGIDDLILNYNNNIIPKDNQQIKDILDLSMYSSEFISPRYDFTLLKVQTITGSSAELIAQTIDSIEEDILYLEEENPGVEVIITGPGAIDRATFNIILSDFLVITFVSMGAIMLIVLFTFKSLSKGMLPMVIVMNALIWTMGIVGYLSLTLTVVSMVSAAMIMGLGIDFGIHQVHSYFENRKKHSSKISTKKTLEELLRAMLGASFTTMAGFLALLFGVLPAMKTLGIILAIGIFTTLIGAIFLLPTILYLYGKKVKK